MIYFCVCFDKEILLIYSSKAADAVLVSLRLAACLSLAKCGVHRGKNVCVLSVKFCRVTQCGDKFVFAFLCACFLMYGTVRGVLSTLELVNIAWNHSSGGVGVRRV